MSSNSVEQESHFLKGQKARVCRLEEQKKTTRARRRRLHEEQQQLQQQQHSHSELQSPDDYISSSPTASPETRSIISDDVDSNNNNNNKLLHEKKFVFRRYRQALALRATTKQQQQQQQQQRQHTPNHTSVGDTKEYDERRMRPLQVEAAAGEDKTNGTHGSDGSSGDDDDRTALCDYEHATIHIWDNRVEILPTTNDVGSSVHAAGTTKTSNNRTMLLSQADAHPPTVLRHLRHCQVYYHIGRRRRRIQEESDAVSSSSSSFFCWQSITLRFVDVRDSTINFSSIMDEDPETNNLHNDDAVSLPSSNTPFGVASIHVTDCHGCTFSSCNQENDDDSIGAGTATTKTATWLMTCQQLRLHESSRLNIFLCVTAGAILEGCTGIVFYRQHQEDDDDDEVDDQSPTRLSVQDFDWLRPGVPSPNYRVLTVPTSWPKTQSRAEPITAKQQPSDPIQQKPDRAAPDNSIVDAENSSESDEDEL